MTEPAPDLPIRHLDAADGTRLAWRELGAGMPVLLLHGYMSDADVNWLRFGHAAAVAEAGFRVILPDLRGHGASDRPHDAAAYPPDILADDAFAVIEALGLEDGGYHLGGYSLGGRTTARMLARGARPARAVIAGMGLEGLTGTGRRADHFRRVLTGIGRHERGSPEWMAAAFLKTTGGDPEALLALLGSFVDTDEATLARIAVPVLVLAGVDDHDNGSAAALARLLPHARLEEVPGNHMSAVTRPELGAAIARFLVDG